MSDESSRMLVDMQAKAPEGHPYVFISCGRLERIDKRQKTGRANGMPVLLSSTI
jgi:hypothetical protein